MSLETEHLDYKIVYREEFDVWSCFELHMEAKSLKALKAKIGQHDADIRRVDNFKAIMLDYNGSLLPVIVTLIADGAECWIVKDKRRSKERFASLIADTPENRAMLKEYAAKSAAAKAAERAASEFLASIPRLSRAQLAEARVAKADEAA